MRRCTRSGITCETAGRAMPGCASIISCSALKLPGAWLTAGVDREVRGRAEGASDHAPAWIVLGESQAARESSAIRENIGRAQATHAEDAALRDGHCWCRWRFFRPSLLSRAAENYLASGLLIRPAPSWVLPIFWCAFIKRNSPRAVVVAWDTLEAPTYRHQQFPAYQSGREFDADLLEQLTPCRNL